MASHQQENSEAMKKTLADIEKQVAQFLDRIVEAESAGLIKAYEDRIKALEAKKVELNEKIKDCGRPLTPFDKTFQTALDFLKNPQKLWDSERFTDKRMVLKLAFAEPAYYS